MVKHEESHKFNILQSISIIIIMINLVLKNDKGQISLDYIIGVSLFILAFFFLYNILAGLLLPFQFNSDEVKPMAERISTALAESSSGLAARDATPNIIDKNKVSQLNSSLSDSGDYASLLTEYGLVTGDINYNMHVSLFYFNNTPYPKNGSSALLDAGPIPEKNSNVGMADRAVYLSQDSQILILRVKVWL